MDPFTLTLLHSEWPKLYGVLAFLSAIGLKVHGLRPCMRICFLSCIGMYHIRAKTCGWMLAILHPLHPFQQYFSYIRMMGG